MERKKKCRRYCSLTFEPVSMICDHNDKFINCANRVQLYTLNDNDSLLVDHGAATLGPIYNTSQKYNSYLSALSVC